MTSSQKNVIIRNAENLINYKYVDKPKFFSKNRIQLKKLTVSMVDLLSRNMPVEPTNDMIVTIMPSPIINPATLPILVFPRLYIRL